MKLKVLVLYYVTLLRRRPIVEKMQQKVYLTMLPSIVLAVVVSFLALNAFAETDNKYYSEYALRRKINDKFDLFFTPEFRAKNNMGNIYYYQWRLGSTFHACKNLDLALAYRYIQTKDSKKGFFR